LKTISGYTNQLAMIPLCAGLTISIIDPVSDL